jgi:hypothetical protein
MGDERRVIKAVISCGLLTMAKLKQFIINKRIESAIETKHT